MKKKMTKRGWLSGLLVGLVMLVGAAPAMAGTYNFVADLCGNTISNNFYYSGTNQLYINGSPIAYYDKFEDSAFISLEKTGSIYKSGGDWSGKWDSKGEEIEYFIVKGANCKNGKGYIALYAWSSGDKTSGSFDLALAFPTVDCLAAVSHVDLYSTSNVPIPGAIWLLGSGLSALLVARRRRK